MVLAGSTPAFFFFVYFLTYYIKIMPAMENLLIIENPAITEDDALVIMSRALNHFYGIKDCCTKIYVVSPDELLEILDDIEDLVTQVKKTRGTKYDMRFERRYALFGHSFTRGDLYSFEGLLYNLSKDIPVLIIGDSIIPEYSWNRFLLDTGYHIYEGLVRVW